MDKWLRELFGKELSEVELFERWQQLVEHKLRQEGRVSAEEMGIAFIQMSIDSAIVDSTDAKAATCEAINDEQPSDIGGKSRPSIAHSIEDIPPLVTKGGTWILANSEEMHSVYGWKSSTLKTSRSQLSIKSVDGKCGVSDKGFMWRVDPKDSKAVWYLVTSLTKNVRREKAEPKTKGHR